MNSLFKILLLILTVSSFSACADEAVIPEKDPVETTAVVSEAVLSKEIISKSAPAVESEYPGMDWTLTNLKGESITLSNYQGKPVMLMFWATWCPYCKKLFPGVNRVYEKYKEQGYAVIAMNIREDGDPEAYMEKRGYKFEVALDADLIAAQYGVRGTPTLVFIDKSGEILGTANIADPEHPLLEQFARQQLGLATQ